MMPQVAEWCHHICGLVPGSSCGAYNLIMSRLSLVTSKTTSRSIPPGAYQLVTVLQMFETSLLILGITCNAAPPVMHQIHHELICSL